MSWTVDLDRCEARHTSGLVVRFRQSDDGWDGEAVEGLDKIRMEDAARLVREAGEAYLAELRKRN